MFNRYFAILLSAFFLPPPSFAQTADEFVCEPGFLQVISGHLKRLNPATGNYTDIGSAAGFSYNAMAYNTADNFLYAYVTGSGSDATGAAVKRGDIIRIDRDGETFKISTSGATNSQYAGDVVNGELWARGSSGTKFWRHSLSGAAPSPTISLQATLPSAADFALLGSVLYGARNGTLYRVETAAAEPLPISSSPVIGLPKGTYGAAYGTESGELFVSNNKGGLYQILNYETGQPSAVFINDTQPTNNNDGSSCLEAEAPFEDSDGDGLINSIEDKNGDGDVDAGETDPFNPDTDGDGVNDGAQVINSNLIYAFEDLKNDNTFLNDFDYNDWVMSVAIQETVSFQGSWTKIVLDIEALARGAGFRHEIFTDLGIRGSASVDFEYLDNTGASLGTGTRTFGSSSDALRELVLFEGDSWDALPPWQGTDSSGNSLGDFANTRFQQGADDLIRGRRTRVTITIDSPELNPRVEDDPATQHLNETINHLFGPWIDVLDSGEQIYQRWRLNSATEDLVTATRYGEDTPLLGFPLEQAVSFPDQWDWPVERVAIWFAYPEFVNFIASGETQSTDWFRSPVGNGVWPTIGALRPFNESPPVARRGDDTYFDHPFASPVSSSPAVADLDGDGDLEVVVGGFLNTIVIHNADGSVNRVIDPIPGTRVESAASVTLADLDGDDDLEILRGYDNGRLYAYHHNGQSAGRWEIGGTIKSTAAVADVDGDGAVEIFVTGGDAKLYGLRANGQNQPGFPIALGGIEDVANNFIILPSPAVADVDGDGRLEIVAVGNGGDIHVVDSRGQSRPGWPVALNETVLASPAVADLDADGKREVIIADNRGRVVVLRANGSVLWQVRRTLGGPSSPAVGDLDGDGVLEVVVGSQDGQLYAWTANGTALADWPIVTGSKVLGSPALADSDGDGRTEVFIGSFDTQLYAVEIPAPDALEEEGAEAVVAIMPAGGGDAFPASLGSAIFSTPAVADIDGDGRPEVIAGAYDRHLHLRQASGALPVRGVAWGQFRGTASQIGAASAATTASGLGVIHRGSFED